MIIYVNLESDFAPKYRIFYGLEPGLRSISYTKGHFSKARILGTIVSSNPPTKQPTSRVQPNFNDEDGCFMPSSCAERS